MAYHIKAIKVFILAIILLYLKTGTKLVTYIAQIMIH